MNSIILFWNGMDKNVKIFLFIYFSLILFDFVVVVLDDDDDDDDDDGGKS